MAATVAIAGILATAAMAGIFAKCRYRRHFRQWKCSQTRPPDRIALRRNFRFRSHRSAGCSRRSSRRCCCCCSTRGRRSRPPQPRWPPTGCPTTCSYIWPDKINNSNHRHCDNGIVSLSYDKNTEAYAASKVKMLARTSCKFRCIDV